MSDTRDPGDAWVTADDGGRYWGRYGAAGLLAYDRDLGSILLQHRVTWSDHGDTWGIPGGALHQHENAEVGAIREAQEEAGVPDDAVRPRYTHVLDRGGWSYTTLIGEVVTAFDPRITDPESHALEWVPVDEVADRPLHPAFATSWELLRPLLSPIPTVVVDTANVVGSVPDGWWRDRRGAAMRLRDRVELLSRSGIRSGFLDIPETKVPGLALAHPDWVLVTEGVARGVPSSPNVRIVDALDLGDDTIVSEVQRLVRAGHHVTVVTGDAELKVRCIAAGATGIRGPKKLLRRLPEIPM